MTDLPTPIPISTAKFLELITDLIEDDELSHSNKRAGFLVTMMGTLVSLGYVEGLDTWLKYDEGKGL